MKRFILAAMGVATIYGCAGTSVETIPAGGDADARGIRYYEAAPFILIKPGKNGGLDSQLIYLPDTTRLRSARPYAIMAKNKSELTFTDGVLTATSVATDNATFPKAILDTIKGLAKAAVAAAFDLPAVKLETVPPPTLLRVAFTPDGLIKLKGVAAVGPNGETRDINVSVGG